MTDREQELFDRWSQDQLSHDEQIELQKMFADAPSLEDAFMRRKQLFQMVAASKDDAFMPFFTDRVMKRLQPERISQYADSFTQSLLLIFRRVALTSILLAIGLAGYNGWNLQDVEDRSALEIAFGVPAVSLDAAFDDLEYTLP